MNFSEDITALLNALLAGVRERLGENLVGVYLRGSLASGDFIAETSDVDVLAVTERRVGDMEFAALAALHAELAAMPNPYADRLEMAYIDRAAVRRFAAGLRHPTLGQGEHGRLAWSEHHNNWILERRTVREQGVALFGPPPQSLIDPVSSDEICTAVRARLRDWVEWAETPDDPEWRAPRSHKTYVVETMCRALYTLARGELASKPRAVGWARDVLAEPWRATVERSQQWRTDKTFDPAFNTEVREFILRVAAYANASARQVAAARRSDSIIFK